MTDILLLDDVASRALASIILERTADVIGSGGEAAASALDQLNADTGLVPDVCAAILTATAWLAGAGELTADAIFAAALAHQPDDDEAAAQPPVEPSEPPAEGRMESPARDEQEAIYGDPEGQSEEVTESGDDGGADEDMAAAIKAAQDAAAAAIARVNEANDAP